MPLQYAVRWLASRRYYQARWWDSARGDDVKRKVPLKFWRKYGLEEPERESDKMHRLALKYAAENVNAVAAELGAQQAGKMTLLEVFDLMCAENPKKVTAETVKKWKVDFANIERHIGKDADPATIDDSDATRYRNAREKDTPRPRNRTIKNELSALKQTLSFGYRWRKVTGMATLELHELPVIEDEESRQVALRQEEALRLIDTPYINHDRNVRWLIFGIATMLRAENLMGLRREWIDRERRWLRIPKEFMKGRRAQKRELSVPIAACAVAVLPEWEEGERGYVWPNPDTGRPTRWAYVNLMRWAEKAGTATFTPHDLRTTGNSWLNAAGVDELTRSILMGHTSAAGSSMQRGRSVTDGYTKILESHLRATLEIFDGVFGEKLPALGTSLEHPIAGSP